ncbi:hypothetical protein ASF61_01965 [Duganella sp. Leaf126]|nr:hypothetical protein ASF61_01965 [Duganella sp. Leaf126]
MWRKLVLLRHRAQRYLENAAVESVKYLGMAGKQRGHALHDTDVMLLRYNGYFCNLRWRDISYLLCGKMWVAIFREQGADAAGQRRQHGRADVVEKQIQQFSAQAGIAAQEQLADDLGERWRLIGQQGMGDAASHRRGRVFADDVLEGLRNTVGIGGGDVASMLLQ